MTAARDGLLIVDKSSGMTSHDVVSRVRRLAGTRKVGHAGTLDPMATGVLVLGINRATKLLTYLVGCDKTYHATIRLGISTLTDDAEGVATARPGVGALLGALSGDLSSDSGGDLSGALLAAARAAMLPLTGDILQVPSSVSAIKIQGERSYARVRSGETVTLAARPVTVSRFVATALRRETLPDLSVIDLDVEVDCSSGTYIRALARDLGAALGTGGHLTALRRIAVGEFGVDSSNTLLNLGCPRAVAERDGLDSWPEPGLTPDELPLISLADAVRNIFVCRIVTDAEARALSYGQLIEPTPVRETTDELTAAFNLAGEVLALLQNQQFYGVLRAKPALNFVVSGA